MNTEEYPKVYLYRRIVQAKLFMDSNYAEKIDLDNIADEAFYSKFHFSRLFKKTYGKTPHQYLTSVRLEQAKQLLISGHPVTEACLAVGFESLSTFTGLFKGREGSTPSVWQHEQLERLNQTQQMPLNFIPNCFATAKAP